MHAKKEKESALELHHVRVVLRLVSLVPIYKATRREDLLARSRKQLNLMYGLGFKMTYNVFVFTFADVFI